MSLSTPFEEILVDYLKHKRYSDRTIELKLIFANRFADWLQNENIAIVDCSYTDVLSFLRQLRKDGHTIANQNVHLNAIRHLYKGLIRQGQATYNPVSNLFVKGHVHRLPHNILSKEQLQKIYEGFSAQNHYQLRNKVILGLYINQGLIRAEMNRLETSDINLIKGTIRIRKNIKLRERTLLLAASQVLMLQEYIKNIRPQMIKQSAQAKGDKLFFSYGNGQTVDEGLRQLLKTLKKKHPELTSLHQIRSSVLAHWIKEKPIREVQYMAGHLHLRSTQRYREINLQDLQESLNEFHPLKK